MNFNSWGPMTILLILLALVIVGVGGAITILHPSTLTFAQYLKDLKDFAIAVAGLGFARAVHQHANASFALAHNTAVAHSDKGDPGKPGA